MPSLRGAAAFAAQCAFPVVAKNAETWIRLRAPVVSGTTVLRTPAELLALALPAGGPPGMILQEYIPNPQEHAQDWNVPSTRPRCRSDQPLLLLKPLVHQALGSTCEELGFTQSLWDG